MHRSGFLISFCVLCFKKKFYCFNISFWWPTLVNIWELIEKLIVGTIRKLNFYCILCPVKFYLSSVDQEGTYLPSMNWQTSCNMVDFFLSELNRNSL